MPHRSPTYIQKKIALIEKGLPIDIAESELKDLEKILRGARSFYIDLIQAFHKRKLKSAENLESFIHEENKNLAGVELALRKVDDFRKEYHKQIKKK